MPLDRLRRICLSLPDVTEKISHGEPAWFVNKRLFATFAGEHHDNRIAVWCAAPEGAQQAMIGSDPVHYFHPPYVGVRGWVGVYLDVPLELEGCRGCDRPGSPNGAVENLNKKGRQ